MQNNLINTTASKISKATATVLVTSQKSDRRYLITESLIVGVTIFLLNRYFVGVAKGLGIEALGERHGEAAKRWLSKLERGKVTPNDIEEGRMQISEGIEAIRNLELDSAVRQKGCSSVSEMLKEHGASKTQAEDTAETIDVAINSDTH